MAVSTSHRLVLHTATLCIWLLAAGSVTYWFLQARQGTPVNLGLPAAMKPDAVDSASVARSLGAVAIQAATPSSISSRFALKGIVSGAVGKEAALIAIDNKPALTFKVGAAVEEGLFLQSATAGKVTLSSTRDGPAVMTLEMPLLDK